MPLKRGSSKETISQNISEFHAGKTYAHTAAKFGKKRANAQAVAVALNTARRCAKRAQGGGLKAKAGGGALEDEGFYVRPGDPESGAPTRIVPKTGRAAEGEGDGWTPFDLAGTLDRIGRSIADPMRRALSTPPSFGEDEPTKRVMEPAISESFGGDWLPEDVQWHDTELGPRLINRKTGEEVKTYRRPDLLPIARNPEGRLEPAMPQLADVFGNIMGGIVPGVGRVAKSGEVALGAGPMLKAKKKANYATGESANPFLAEMSEAVTEPFEAKPKGIGLALKKALKTPYPADLAVKAVEANLDADELYNLASYLSDGAKSAFWTKHKKLSPPKQAPKPEIKEAPAFTPQMAKEMGVQVPGDDMLKQKPLYWNPETADWQDAPSGGALEVKPLKKSAEADIAKLAQESMKWSPSKINETLYGMNVQDAELFLLIREQLLDKAGGNIAKKEVIGGPEFDDFEVPSQPMATTKPLASNAPPAAFGTNFGPEMSLNNLEQIGGQLGSNSGGQFRDKAGNLFYIKQPKSKEAARHELIGASLYNLAGVQTLKYRPVKGGAAIATEWQTPDVSNAYQLSKAEKAEAYKDYAVHAWLGGYDAVGTGGDNLGWHKGKPIVLDTGGTLEYRAQGAPKGDFFTAKVTDLDDMRNPNSKAAQANSAYAHAANFFGNITDAEVAESARRVAKIPDAKIREVIKAHGGSDELVEKMQARKRYIVERYKLYDDDPDLVPEVPKSLTDEGQYGYDVHTQASIDHTAPPAKDAAGFLKFHPGTSKTQVLDKLLTPVEDWKSWKPKSSKVDKLGSPQTHKTKDWLRYYGFNPDVGFYHRGEAAIAEELLPTEAPFNPHKHYKSERAIFLSHHPGEVMLNWTKPTNTKDPFIIRAPKKGDVLEIDWSLANGHINHSSGLLVPGSEEYHSIVMGQVIEAARKKGAKFVIVRGINDSNGFTNQYLVIDPSIMRHVSAEFDPNKFHLLRPYAGLAGGGIFGYGLLGGERRREPDKMARGGRLDKALKVAQHYAKGGPLKKEGLGDPNNHVPFDGGMLHSDVPGRTDKLPIRLRSGSYVIPADIPSASSLGEGNTMAGKKVLDRMLEPHRMRGKQIANIVTPSLKKRRMFRSDGGGVDHDIPVVAAGGEYVVDPETVASVGNGSIEKGHDALDRFVKKVRRDNVKALSRLPGPKTN